MGTILIVDDERPIRDFLAMLLEDAGHHTLRAIHDADALKQVEAERPDLVIADVMMPVLNGADLCRRLKAAPQTRPIPVILMSAGAFRAPDDAGADAFITKPFDLDEMEALVKKWLAPEPV